MKDAVAAATNNKVNIDRPTHKGIAVQVKAPEVRSVLFDMDLLRYSAGWSGEFIKLRDDREDERAEYRSSVGDNLTFFTKPGAGWARNGEWKEDRPRGLGPLPREWAKYKGHYRYGDRVVFHYTVGDMKVLDSPGSQGLATTRSLQCFPTTQEHTVLISDSPNANAVRRKRVEGIDLLWFESGDGNGVAIVLSQDGNQSRALRLAARDGRCELTIPPHENSINLRLHLWRGNEEHLSEFVGSLSYTGVGSLEPMTKGGLPRWDEEILTRGEVDNSVAAFSVDKLTLPFENRWNCLLYTSGLDFFSNGDGALCTSHGDVWVVSGIDEKLERLAWRRIASGLSNPLGLKIVDDKIYVTCLDQIVRLHDLNGDREIDYYECFNNDCQVSHQHHRFATGLETDSNGDFYFCKCTEEGGTDHGGTVIRVSKDGNTFETVATGLRNPNGMAIGPNDLITFGKQQGGWIPSSAIHVVKPGDFTATCQLIIAKRLRTISKNRCAGFLMASDNSTGGQVWVPENANWGPLNGKLLHLSYGKCQLFLVLQEQVNGEHQGGVVRIPGD